MNLFLIKCLFIIILFFNGAIAGAKSNNVPIFKAGEHFQILPSSMCYLTSTKAYAIKFIPKVIVFFNYGCFGCKQMNQEFNRWKKINKTKVEIYRYPVCFNKPWENLAKLYYVQQELFPNDDGEQIFQEIYANNKRLWLETEMIEFYEKRRISKEVFLKKYHSFDIDRKIKKAIEMSNNYKVALTPNIIVNAKQNSYVVNFSMVPDPETLFKVVDYLIQNHPTT